MKVISCKLCIWSCFFPSSSSPSSVAFQAILHCLPLGTLTEVGILQCQITEFMLWTAQVKESTASAVTQYKITVLIYLGNYMVCHKTYHVIKHGINNKLTFPIFQITIHLHKTASCLPFACRYSSILSQNRCCRKKPMMEWDWESLLH